ncbi:MAG: methyltransferase domain-containing protein [Nanoarchaeota archaeon]|nr:methyltransferase domain-containing protein [Nanoarchaeota archaeon]
MAQKGRNFERAIQNKILRPLRLKAVLKVIKMLPAGAILDVGCMDDYLLKMLDRKFDYLGIDEEPLSDSERIKKLRIEDIGKKKKYDIVIATEVLEHLENPVDAIKKFKKLSKKYILISVPNEPFFSLFRFFIPAREHLWTIYPQTLKKHLGEPIYETRACFRRTYIALWDLGPKNE